MACVEIEQQILFFSFGFACISEVRHIVFDGVVEKPSVSAFQNFNSLYHQLLWFWNFTRTGTQVLFSYPDLVYQTVCNTKWLIFMISCKKSGSRWTAFKHFESHALGMRTTL